MRGSRSAASSRWTRARTRAASRRSCSPSRRRSARSRSSCSSHRSTPSASRHVKGNAAWRSLMRVALGGGPGAGSARHRADVRQQAQLRAVLRVALSRFPAGAPCWTGAWCSSRCRSSHGLSSCSTTTRAPACRCSSSWLALAPLHTRTHDTAVRVCAEQEQPAQLWRVVAARHIAVPRDQARCSCVVMAAQARAASSWRRTATGCCRCRRQTRPMTCTRSNTRPLPCATTCSSAACLRCPPAADAPAGRPSRATTSTLACFSSTVCTCRSLEAVTASRRCGAGRVA